MLALAAAGCSSSSAPQHAAPLPVGGPPKLIRVALADLLWPLEPERAKTRDQIVVARMLFSTPLRTDLAGQRCGPACARAGAGPGSCGACAAATPARSRSSSGTRGSSQARLPVKGELRLPTSEPDVPLPPDRGAGGTARRARAVPADLGQPDADRGGAQRASASSCASSSPSARCSSSARGSSTRRRSRSATSAPRSSTRSSRPRCAYVGCSRSMPSSSTASIPRKLRHVYDDTADRADYQALVPEFEAPPAENLHDRGQPSASQAAIALRDAKQRIPSLPKRRRRLRARVRPDARVRHEPARRGLARPRPRRSCRRQGRRARAPRRGRTRSSRR